MEFDWDDSKAETNKKKHGVSFAEAATAFQDPNVLEALDEDHIIRGYTSEKKI